MSWWASYRVRSWVTISSPTDVSDRNPRFSKFVMDCKNDDEVTFIEQAGHAGPPCSGSRPPLARRFKLGQTKFLDDLTLSCSAGNVQRRLSSFRQCGLNFMDEQRNQCADDSSRWFGTANGAQGRRHHGSIQRAVLLYSLPLYSSDGDLSSFGRRLPQNENNY
jgi:hypothetical protein